VTQNMTSNHCLSFKAACFIVTVSALLCSCRPRYVSDPPSCYNNLRMIDGAKAQIAYQQHLTNGSVVTERDLLAYLPHGQWPQCPSEGRYTIGKIGESPRCAYHNQYQLSQ
jgi:hypothetical protein